MPLDGNNIMFLFYWNLNNNCGGDFYCGIVQTALFLGCSVLYIYAVVIALGAG